jgi:hypothetical protein
VVISDPDKGNSCDFGNYFALAPINCVVGGFEEMRIEALTLKSISILMAARRNRPLDKKSAPSSTAFVTPTSLRTDGVTRESYSKENGKCHSDEGAIWTRLGSQGSKTEKGFLEYASNNSGSPLFSVGNSIG